MDFDLTYISLGCGVQSSALLLMSDTGAYDVPKADVAIFADTQCEPSWVYETLDRLKAASSIPVEVVTAGSLVQDIIDRHNGKRSRFAAIPAWTDSNGTAVPLRRQCTSEYKIRPIEKRVREFLGYEPRQRIKHRVRCLLGISLDEYHRARSSRTAWVTNSFPLLDAGINRERCKEFVAEAGLRIPYKSACLLCPYHSNDYWRSLRDHFPKEWARACRYDEAIRDMSRSGIPRPVYLHRSLKPLPEAPLGDDQLGFDWDNECGGLCGL